MISLFAGSGRHWPNKNAFYGSRPMVKLDCTSLVIEVPRVLLPTVQPSSAQQIAVMLSLVKFLVRNR